MAVKSKRKITYTKVNRSPSADNVSALFKELLQITGLTKSDYADLTAELPGVETVREASVKTWLYNGVLPSKGSRKTVLRMFELLCEQALAEQWSQTFIDLEIKAKQERKRSPRSGHHAGVIADSSIAENSRPVSGEPLNRESSVEEEVLHNKLSFPLRLAERFGRPHRTGIGLVVGALFFTSVLLFLASVMNRVTIVNEIVIADCSADLTDRKPNRVSEYSVRVIKNSIPADEQMEQASEKNTVINSDYPSDTCHLVLPQQTEQGVKIQLPAKQKQLVNRPGRQEPQKERPDGGS